MGYLFRMFAKKDDLKLVKTNTGEWVVKKNLRILYVGNKEKCQTYMNQLRTA